MNPLIYKRLYRSLLKATKPFCSPSPHASVISCLLHRTGIDDDDDDDDEKAWMNYKEEEEDFRSSNLRRRDDNRHLRARDLSKSYALDERNTNKEEKELLDEDEDAPLLMFRTLLREVLDSTNTTTSIRQMQFPNQVNTTILQTIVRREFRRSYNDTSLEIRRRVAFLALRELNKKLIRAEQMQTSFAVATMNKNEPKKDKEVTTSQEQQEQYLKRRVMKDITSSTIIEPGITYLLAHPLLTGYFYRTVICILDHTNKEEDEQRGGTYGLIINRGTTPTTTQTLADVLRTVPEPLHHFQQSTVRDGGPVHMSLQMIHAISENTMTTNSSSEENTIGGILLSNYQSNPTATAAAAAALTTDRAIYYNGDILEAAKAVEEGILYQDDIRFYVGASCWEKGQLENELEHGFWLPCFGPPEMVLTDTNDENDENDLWLRMMSSLGQEEALLAHWHHSYDNDDDDNNAYPCDTQF